MELDVYWKQDQNLSVLHWLPSNFYLTVILCLKNDLSCEICDLITLDLKKILKIK